MNQRILLQSIFVFFLFASLLVGCGDGDDDATIKPPEGEEFMSISLTSSAFQDSKPIPTKYTCDENNISPPLRWSDPPEGTKSFVIVCNDPDAASGTWIHWLLYNIPGDTRSLPEAVSTAPNLADGSSNGKNSWNNSGYEGPCPPSSTHLYSFKIYALDIVLNIDAGANKEILYTIMDGHVLARGELTGTYSRSYLD